MASLKFVAAASMIVMVIVISSLWAATEFGVLVLNTEDNPNPIIIQDSTEPEKPSANYIYTGQLQVNLPQYTWSNNSRISVRSGLPDVFIYRSDKSTLFGSDDGTTGYIESDINQAADAKLYMVIDYGSGTNYWIVPSEIESQTSPYLIKTSHTYFDHDGDNQAEDMYELDFTSLGPLQAGESEKVKTVNIYNCWAEASPTITSMLNATLTAGSYQDYEAKLYFSSWTAEGYGLKLNELRLDTYGVGTGASGTIWDNGTAIFKSITIITGNPTVSSSKPYTTFTSAFNPSTNSSTVNLGLSDPMDPYKGILILYGENYGSTSLTITIKFSINLAGSFDVTPNFKYIDPSGSVASIYAVGTSDPCVRYTT